MRDDIRVLVLGTGQMGAGIARLLVVKPGLKLVGAFARRTERAGMDVGAAIDLGRELGISVGVELETVTQFYLLDAVITRNWAAFKDALWHIIMPAFTLSTIPTAIVARMTRSAMLEVLRRFRPYAGLLRKHGGGPGKSGSMKGVWNYAGYLADGKAYVIMLNQQANQRMAVLRRLQRSTFSAAK